MKRQQRAARIAGTVGHHERSRQIIEAFEQLGLLPDDPVPVLPRYRRTAQGALDDIRGYAQPDGLRILLYGCAFCRRHVQHVPFATQFISLFLGAS